MLQNLERLVGADAILRAHIVNEGNSRDKTNIELKNIIYLLTYPVKIFLLVMVMWGKLPGYIGTIVIVSEWFAIATSIFYFKKLNSIHSEWHIVSKKDRLLSYTDYNLLISLFERPVLEVAHNLSKCIFLFSVVLSGRWIQVFIFISGWMYVSKQRDICKADVVLYLRELIKEDLNIYGIA